MSALCKNSKNRGNPRKSRRLRGFPKDSFLMKENLSWMKSDRGEGRADQARPPSFLVLFNFLTAGQKAADGTGCRAAQGTGNRSDTAGENRAADRTDDSTAASADQCSLDGSSKIPSAVYHFHFIQIQCHCIIYNHYPLFPPCGLRFCFLWELFVPCTCIYGEDGLVGSFFPKEGEAFQIFRNTVKAKDS